jgi:hypothetical protein
MKKLLSASYWIGIFADGLSVIPLFSPTVANLLFQPRSFEVSTNYLYVSRIAGALMLGWTVLLLWAQCKPVERADILLITLFPVVTLLAVAAGAVAQSNEIPISRLLPMFAIYVVVYGTFIPSFLWAKRQSLSVRKVL